MTTTLETSPERLLRPMACGDAQALVELNRAVAHLTSPMELADIERLCAIADLVRVVEIDGGVAAFVIGLCGDNSYRSANFDWFCERYPSHLYVDRVVVSPPYRRSGIGRALYAEVFAAAVAQRIPVVTCEYNAKPVNGGSRDFHLRLGFEEVGIRILSRDRVLSMQAREVYAGSRQESAISTGWVEP